MKKTSKFKSKKYPKLKKYALGSNPNDPLMPVTATNNPVGNIDPMDPRFKKNYQLTQKVSLGDQSQYYKGNVNLTPEEFAKINKSGDIRSMTGVMPITEQDWAKNIGTGNQMIDYQRHMYGGVQLPKYAYGDTVDGGLTPMTVPEDPSLRPYSAPAESAAVTQQKQQQAQLQANANAQAKKEKNAANASTAVNVGSAAVSGGIGMYNAFSNPNSTMAQKQAATNATTDAVVGAINPIAGTITGVAHQIADPIKADLEKTDSSGNLVNESGARTGAIIGSWLDPVQAISTRASYDGGWTDITGKGYTAQLEKEAKDRIASEKAHNDQIAAQEKQKQDQINQQIQSGIQSGIQSYYENPDNNKNQSQTFAMGGVPQMPNAEVEGNEMITSNTRPQTFGGGGVELASNNPYGTPTYKTNGASHADGGMPISMAPGSVINGKTINPMTGNKFTKDIDAIAKMESKFTKKAESGDKYSRTMAKLMLPTLAMKKEKLNELQKYVIANNEERKALKNGMIPSRDNEMSEPQGMPEQAEGEMVMARYGAQMPIYDEEAVEYKDGGIYIKPENRGKFTAYKERTGKTTAEALQSPNAHVRQMANFARNAAKWKHEMGGMQGLPKYEVGMTPDSLIGDPNKGYYVNGAWNAYPTYARSTPEGTFNAAGEQTSDAYGMPMAQTFDPIQSIQTDPNNPLIVTNSTNKVQAEKDLQNSFNKDVAPRADGSMPGPNPKDYSNYQDYAREAAIFAGQNLGNISDLIRTRGGRKYDKESYGQMTPQMPDFTEAKRNAKSEASAYRRMLPGLTGGNAGATLGMMGQMQGLSQQALAKIVEGEQQARAGVYNQFLPLNKQLQMQERADTQANKARSEDIARMATSGIAATIGGAGLDYGMSKGDQEKLDLISKAYPDYNYDKRKKAWYHKYTNEKLDPTKVQAATTTGK